MQQHNHKTKQPNDFEINKLQQRKTRSTSQSRLCSSSNSVKKIVTNKNKDNGKKCKDNSTRN